MKKIGLLIFITAIVVGISLANVFSFGKLSGRIFNFSINRGVAGSGNTASEKRHLTDFKKIETSGVIEVEASAGKDFSVEVEADDNLLPLIKTEVSGGVLRLRTEKNITTKNPIRVRITAPDIESLEVSGASKMSLDNVSNENLQIDASGASKITIAGETANLIIDASGASGVKVFAANQLKADASGASSVSYSGSPKNLIKKTSGASSIKEK